MAALSIQATLIELEAVEKGNYHFQKKETLSSKDLKYESKVPVLGFRDSFDSIRNSENDKISNFILFISLTKCYNLVQLIKHKKVK